jgi:hypothetical protein
MHDTSAVVVWFQKWLIHKQSEAHLELQLSARGFGEPTVKGGAARACWPCLCMPAAVSALVHCIANSLNNA